MKINKNVFVNFPCALSFSQEIRDKTFKSPQQCSKEPCPQTYNPQLQLIKEKIPEIKISKSKFLNVKFQNDMGPGDYNPQKQIIQHQVSFSKQSKQQLNQQSNDLGPQFYKIEKKHQQKIQNRCFMGEKNNEVIIKDIVGPGRYFEDSPSSFSQSNVKSLKGSFGQQKRFHNVEYKNLVGPQDYKISEQQNQPQYTMTGKCKKLNNSFKQPQIGPGCYTDQSYSAKFAKSIGIKFQPEKPKNDIGPGQYDINNNENKLFKMKTALRRPIDFGKNDQVSSQSYELSVVNKNSKSCIFSSQNYQKLFSRYLQDSENLPGPLSYKQDNDKKYANLKFTIPKTNRNQIDIKGKTPGPDAYICKKRFQGIQISFAKAQDQLQIITPGPGQYNHDKSDQGQKFSVPKEGIAPKLKQSLLGPGKYQIQQDFGQLPTYQQKRLLNHQQLIQKNSLSNDSSQNQQNI